jgi:hypothetical protein
MRTTAAPNPAQALDSDVYDPDDVFPRNSPFLEPLHPTLRPSPSPPPLLDLSPASSPRSPGDKGPSHRRKARRNPGNDVLLRHLDNNRHGFEAWTLTSESEDSEDPELRADSESLRDPSPAGKGVGEGEDPDRLSKRGGEAGRMTSGSPAKGDMGALHLKSLAAGALAAAAETPARPQPDAGPTPPVTENDVVGGRVQPASGPLAIHTRQPLRDERNIPSPYSPHSIHSPRDSGATPMSLKMDMRSPTASIHSSSHSEGLPPMHFSPGRYETNGPTLPSIRSQLGDLPQLGSNHGVGNGIRGSHHGFPGSPPATMPRLPSLHSLASPPMPPAESYRDPLSPGHQLAGPALSPRYYYAQPNGLHRPHDYASNSSEGPGSHHSGSPPTQGLDRMSIDSMTTTGSYVCKVPGCIAQPFQTQYLLNSHANVHSSARPHYCPVLGCPRAEGGKGFKRKNEMIRHGLVHDSPGYICPFCPDRDHRYPRPDNLQR